MELEKVVKNLQFRGYEVVVLENREQAFNEIIKRIEKTSLVSYGGSKSLEELDIINYLRAHNYNLLDRNKVGLSSEEVYEIERKSFMSDIYLCSTNAIAKSGELVNIDGKGNRVAAQIFGPNKVFIVAGINKICDTLADAQNRVQQYVAPINARRFKGHLKTGCMETRKCVSCVGQDSICKSIVVIRRTHYPNRSVIFLVKEELGF